MKPSGARASRRRSPRWRPWLPPISRRVLRCKFAAAKVLRHWFRGECRPIRSGDT